VASRKKSSALGPRRLTAEGREPPGEWWATYFDAQYLLEYEPIFRLQQDRREVARLMEILALPDGSRVLDCPCGQGRHAHLLAEAGFDVDGLDYSADLLAIAKRRGTGKRLRYTRGDMRKLPARWTGRFEFATWWYTFRVEATGAVRVKVDGAVVLEDWADRDVSRIVEVPVRMREGVHDVVVEQFTAHRGEHIKVDWSPFLLDG